MKTIAMIPTYNEAGNIEPLINDILALPVDTEVLVVDDSSPDGTSDIVNKLAQSDKRIHLLLRKERRGRGWAGIDGFKKALEMQADFVVEMDGDHSHSPSFIPGFIEKISTADMVVGSRYVAGGKDENRTFLRRIISEFARRYLCFVLGVKMADPTSGFRMYTASALEKIVPYLKARDPFIVAEVLYTAKKLGLNIAESPIEFMTRSTGTSKLAPSTLFKYLLRAFCLRLGCFR